MPTYEQLLKAAVLSQYVTRALIPITTFRYYKIAKIIYVEAGYDEEFNLAINKNGDFIDV